PAAGIYATPLPAVTAPASCVVRVPAFKPRAARPVRKSASLTCGGPTPDGGTFMVLDEARVDHAFRIPVDAIRSLALLLRLGLASLAHRDGDGLLLRLARVHLGPDVLRDDLLAGALLQWHQVTSCRCASCAQVWPVPRWAFPPSARPPGHCSPTARASAS